MHGEVPVDREFNFSQAISSIEVKNSETDMQRRAALIPGFVAEKANEIRSESESGQDKFGTGDFPEELAARPN